ncbi:uncharacterized protein LOC144098177 [Amblyomma americanum]
MKNFRKLNKVKPQAVKKEAQHLCDAFNLTKLGTAVRKSKGLCLSAFFTVKTHKDNWPFRVIVSEKGTWQHSMGKFLQDSLSLLAVEDPFQVKKPEEVSSFLHGSCPKGVSVFSIDVKDLYYSLLHPSLFDVIREGIEALGTVRFQNACGTSTEKFLEAMAFYLRSTFISFNNELFVQRQGVCTGSCVAPLLSDLLLAKADRRLKEALLNTNAVRVFRFVDDFLVVYKTSDQDPGKDVEALFKVFSENLGEFELTKELPDEGQLQYLDLRLFPSEDHLCWCCAPRSKKNLLPYSSSHTKLVKRAIALGVLKNALKRSCYHRQQASTESQLKRLREAGFPDALISGIGSKLLKDLRQSGPPKKPRK